MIKAKAGFRSNAKSKVDDYKEDLRKAFYRGYKSGYSDANAIPNSFGAKSNAVFGYRQGINGYRQVKKASKRLSNSERY